MMQKIIKKIEHHDVERKASPDSDSLEVDGQAVLEDINTNDLQRDLLTMNYMCSKLVASQEE